MLLYAYRIMIRMCLLFCFFFQAEDGIRDLVRSRGLGDVYKRQPVRPTRYKDRNRRRRCSGARCICGSDSGEGSDRSMRPGQDQELLPRVVPWDLSALKNYRAAQ